MKLVYKLFLILSVVAFVSCEDLTELNQNPNGSDPATVQPNLLLATVISKTARPYLDESYNGGTAGVMQYVQKSGWGDELNKYNWLGEKDWGTWYGNLRDAQFMYDRAVEEDNIFLQGVAIIIRAFNFGYIADSWGDAPYSKALQADKNDVATLFPAFDSQEEIYKGIIAELQSASALLSGAPHTQNDYDLMYNGNPENWKKLANSLIMRYAMRISSKDAAFAKTAFAGAYTAAFESNGDNASMGFVGSVSGDSWPAAIKFDASESNFNRIQLCAGFRDVLVENNDPRIATWFNKPQVPVKISADHGTDVINRDNGVDYVHPDSMAARGYVVYNKNTWVDDVNNDAVLIDTLEYSGIPIASTTGDGSGWNLNPSVIQGGPNVHNSQLADMFKEAKGDLLEAKLITYAEVCFLNSEAKMKGWSVSGTQQEWYAAGIEASFDYWGVDGYDEFIAGAGVAYDGSLEQLITQKWVANYTVAHESWCDWRRTGYPDLTVGPKGRRDAMPIRYRYGGSEKDRNNDNYNSAVSKLVETANSGTEGKDSSWSKFWLLQ
uniref:SusD/RagB family nutrient-binding outer membrane lipoprotein n=1 Tax=uncultured Draconibacterium sp. TaxID=1573823 RepID=UPI0032180432